MKVRVLLNDGPGRFQPFIPATAELREAVVQGWSAPDDGLTVWDILESLFAFCNGQDPQSELWYVHGNRSLSVGDVVVLETNEGPHAYACDRSGWSHLDDVPEVMYTTPST